MPTHRLPATRIKTAFTLRHGNEGVFNYEPVLTTSNQLLNLFCQFTFCFYHKFSATFSMCCLPWCTIFSLSFIYVRVHSLSTCKNLHSPLKYDSAENEEKNWAKNLHREYKKWRWLFFRLVFCKRPLALWNCGWLTPTKKYAIDSW